MQFQRARRGDEGIFPYNLDSSRKRPPTVITKMFTKTCLTCGSSFDTPAPNRKPYCNECKKLVKGAA